MKLKSIMNELQGRQIQKEGIMSDINLLAQESGTFDDFMKSFIQEFSDNKPIAAEEKEMLQQIFDDAKAVQEGKKTGLIEVVSAPIGREIVTMIYEVAADYGAKNLPNKQWKSTTKLVRFLCEKIDKKHRVEFVKSVKTIREAMDINEFTINLD
jgi:hypothetical protein